MPTLSWIFERIAEMVRAIPDFLASIPTELRWLAESGAKQAEQQEVALKEFTTFLKEYRYYRDTGQVMRDPPEDFLLLVNEFEARPGSMEFYADWEEEQKLETVEINSAGHVGTRREHLAQLRQRQLDTLTSVGPFGLLAMMFTYANTGDINSAIEAGAKLKGADGLVAGAGKTFQGILEPAGIGSENAPISAPPPNRAVSEPPATEWPR